MVALSVERFEYLDNEGKCSHQSFFEQWKTYLLEDVSSYQDCKNICTSKKLPFEEIPACYWNDAIDNCADEKIYRHFKVYIFCSQNLSFNRIRLKLFLLLGFSKIQ